MCVYVSVFHGGAGAGGCEAGGSKVIPPPSRCAFFFHHAPLLLLLSLSAAVASSSAAAAAHRFGRYLSEAVPLVIKYGHNAAEGDDELREFVLQVRCGMGVL